MASWFQTQGGRALVLARKPRVRLALQLLAFAVLTGSLAYAVRDSWSDAKELLRTADPVSLGLGLCWALGLLLSGLSVDLRTALTDLTTHRALLITLYSFIIGMGYALLEIPLSYYSGFILPQRFEFSTHNFIDNSLFISHQ